MATPVTAVPEPPIRHPMIMSGGSLSPVWAQWFTILWKNNVDVDQAASLDILESQINSADGKISNANLLISNLSIENEVNNASSLYAVGSLKSIKDDLNDIKIQVSMLPDIDIFIKIINNRMENLEIMSALNYDIDLF